MSAPLSRGGRGRRCRDAESRHDRRQYRQRVTGRRYAAGAPRVRRRRRARVPARHARRCPRSLSPRLQEARSRAGRAARSASRLRRGRGGWLSSWRKVGTRRAQAISKVCVAAAIEFAGDAVHDVRVALGSVAPTVARSFGAESVLRGRALTTETIGEACAALVHDISPIDDIRSTALYRQRVARNLLEEFLTSAV